MQCLVVLAVHCSKLDVVKTADSAVKVPLVVTCFAIHGTLLNLICIVDNRGSHFDQKVT